MFSYAILGLIAFAILVNLHLGYLRQNCEKFSFGWYFYVHISIPIIIFLRTKLGYSWKYIPLTIGAAIVGQIIGGKIRLWRDRRG
jgi:hypothetical protein